MNELNNTRKLRWGILGCAGIADQHLIRAIQQSASGDVIAVASRTVEKSQSIAERHGIARFYGNYEELLSDNDVEAVYIPLPNHLHYEWVLRAASAGKHVLCEKPMALNAAEAAAMAEACGKANVLLAEAFMYRHHPRYERAKQILHSGQIGEIRGFTGLFTFDLSNRKGDIRFRSDMGGGSVYDDGCYPISASRMLLGAEPEAVTAHSMFSPQHDNVDMMNSVLLEFPSGVGGMLQFGMWCDGRNEITILGSEGSLIIPDAFYYEPPAATRIILNVRGDRTEEHFEPINHYVTQIEDFNRSVMKGESHPYPQDDSIANMRIIDAVRESAKERKRVAITRP